MLWVGTVQSNKSLLDGMDPSNDYLLDGTNPFNKDWLNGPLLSPWNFGLQDSIVLGDFGNAGIHARIALIGGLAAHGTNCSWSSQS